MTWCCLRERAEQFSCLEWEKGGKAGIFLDLQRVFFSLGITFDSFQPSTHFFIQDNNNIVTGKQRMQSCPKIMPLLEATHNMH